MDRSLLQDSNGTSGRSPPLFQTPDEESERSAPVLRVSRLVIDIALGSI